MYASSLSRPAEAKTSSLVAVCGFAVVAAVAGLLSYELVAPTQAYTAVRPARQIMTGSAPVTRMSGASNAAALAPVSATNIVIDSVEPLSITSTNAVATAGKAIAFLGMAAALLASAGRLLSAVRCSCCGAFGHQAAQCSRLEALALLSTSGERACQSCGVAGHSAAQCQCKVCGGAGHSPAQCQVVAMYSATGEKAEDSKEKMRRMVEELDMEDMKLLTRGGSMAEVVRSKGIDEVAVAVRAELASRKDLTPKDVILEMQRGNGRFWMGLSEREDMSAMQRRALIMAQAPKICILSCSDSRVPVEIIFDQGLGEIFVVRTAGNILDVNAHGSIEYAVKYLGVKVLLVIGHEGCGAVKGAISMSPEDISKEPEELQTVLNSIKGKLNVKELGTISDTRSREREAIVLNTSNQVKMLQENKLIAEQVKDGKLIVAGAFYEISSGIVDFFSLDKNGFVVDM